MNPELEQRILSCPTLPTLPAVALQVLRLCQDEDLDLRRISDALASDPALTARVLRAANSASLAARGKVSTLARAVPLLGSKAVIALALSFSLVRSRRRNEPDGFDLAGFWRRAVFAALAGRTLAEGVSSPLDPEEAFVAALLQDLGMLALWEAFQPEYGSMCRKAAGDHGALARLEREGWGADHSEVSALLARTWMLPAQLQRAVRGSHGVPGPYASPYEARLVECVALSGLLADMWIGSADDGALVPALEAARGRLGFDATSLDAVVGRMALAVPEASADFDIQLAGRLAPDDVLAEARKLRGTLGVEEGAGGTRDAREPAGATEGSLRFAFECARSRREPIALIVVFPANPGSAPALGSQVRSWVRFTDLVTRTGDGDALLLLPSTDLTGARAVAARVIEAARRSPASPPVGIAVAALSPPPRQAPLDALRLPLVELVRARRADSVGKVLVLAPRLSHTGALA